MRKGIEALAAIHFFLVLTLLFFGLFLMVLPKAPQFRFFLSELISQRSYLFAPIGGIISGVAILLIAAFYTFYRHRTLIVRMHYNPIEVDPHVVEKYITDYFQEFFPNVLSRTQVEVSKKQKLEITLFTAEIPEEDSEDFLLQCEHELGGLFRRVFDYEKDFLFKWVRDTTTVSSK